MIAGQEGTRARRPEGTKGRKGRPARRLSCSFLRTKRSRVPNAIAPAMEQPVPVLASVNPWEEVMRARTRRFALDVMTFVRDLSVDVAIDPVRRQLVRAATGVAGNYRSACRARSHAEFIARIGVVLEEADEAEGWLDLLHADVRSIRRSYSGCAMKASSFGQFSSRPTSPRVRPATPVGVNFVRVPVARTTFLPSYLPAFLPSCLSDSVAPTSPTRTRARSSAERLPPACPR